MKKLFSSTTPYIILVVIYVFSPLTLMAQTGKGAASLAIFPLKTANNWQRDYGKYKTDALRTVGAVTERFRKNREKYTINDKPDVDFLKIHLGAVSRPFIAVIPVFANKYNKQGIYFFSYNCTNQKFIGQAYLDNINPNLTDEEFDILERDLFPEKAWSDSKINGIKLIFEQYYFNYIAFWYQDPNLTTPDTTHGAEFKYNLDVFMEEYKYFKSKEYTAYIDKFQRAISARECPSDLFPGKEIQKCLDLRQKMTEYPATIAFINMLAYYEKYWFVNRSNTYKAEKYLPQFLDAYKNFEQIMKDHRYTKKDIEYWENENFILRDEGAALKAKFELFSKCDTLKSLANNSNLARDYNNTVKYSFQALQLCHEKSAFDTINQINKSREKEFYDLVKQGDVYYNAGNYFNASEKFREAIKYALFPDYPLEMIDKCSKEISAQVDTSNTVAALFSIAKNLCSIYNTVHYKEVPGREITFEIDSKNNKKVTFAIANNNQIADYAVHIFHYPPGEYKFANEETEDGLVITILNYINTILKDQIDTSGIELSITGYADMSGFKGKNLKVDSDYLNQDLSVTDKYGDRHKLNDLANSNSNYDKNLALAFLRAYRKKEIIMKECPEIKIKPILEAYVDSNSGESSRSVKIVIRLTLR